MSYRIRAVPEFDVWLGELRGDDPGAADLVDKAVDLLREAGAGLGPPLVVPVEEPNRPVRPDLDLSYQRQLQMLTRVRRGVADVATARKRLEMQIHQLEEQVIRLESQLEAGDEPTARSLWSVAEERLADLRGQYANVHSEEERLTVASQRLQARVDNFRIRKEALKAAEVEAEAAAEAVRAEAMIEPVARDLDPDGTAGPTKASPASEPCPPELSELRPGAPESAGIRILFTVGPPDTVLLLAAGTERDWLQAWYAEMILRCRVRYEREHGNTD